MASTSVSRALKRSAQLSAKRVPRRTAAEAAVSDHVLKARGNFTYFCSAMGKTPAPHMIEWHQQLVTGQSNDHLLDVAGQNTCLLSPRGPLDLATPVATPKGWRRLRDVRKGDTVYTSAGEVTTVADTVSYGEQPCWEVKLSDGTTVVCDATHKWLVRPAARPDSGWRATTLERLRTSVVLADRACPQARDPGQTESPWLTTAGRHRWEVPVADRVALPRARLPVDPYLLGVLVTRGSLSNNGVRLTAGAKDMVERLAASVPRGCGMNKTAGGGRIWSIIGVTGRAGRRRREPRNPLLHQLEDLGLWKSSPQERWIPPAYLRGSISQRTALLQGLLDGAGTVRHSGTVVLCARSAAVAAGAVEVARSLGAVAWLPPARPGRVHPSYPVCMILPPEVEPFHRRDKAKGYLQHLKARRPGALKRTIVDIRPVGLREVGCIEVESPLHDFLIRDYVVSCNSAKSTEVGLLCAWLIGRHAMAHKLLRILYVSFNVDVARSKSLAIKNTIQSEAFREIFPMVRLSKTRISDELWAIDFEHAGIDVRGEDAFTLACAGLRGTITSKRSNLVVLDDLIKSKEAIKNPEVRREMEQNWSTVIVPTMFEGARAVALGTRFHFDDMFATTFTEKKGWKVLTQGAILYDDEGEARSYWPEMWSLSYLLELKRDDHIAFAYQYMNQAVRSTELGLSPDLFIRGQIPDSFDEIGVGVDLSSGLSERNDYTVFMLGGRDGDKAYVIDKRRMRCMGNIEKIEALCDLLHEWNLLGMDERGRYTRTGSEVVIWPEIVAYQKSFQGDLKRMLFEDRGLFNVRVSPVKGIRGDKLARFRGVMGLFETGRVVFNKYRDFQVVFDEVMNMGHSPHEDCADALQILLDRLMRRSNAEVEWT